MKPLLITLCAAGAALGISLSPSLPVSKSGEKRPIGPCMPYAERCLNCADCTACKHCAGNGGKCSVCFKK